LILGNGVIKLRKKNIFLKEKKLDNLAKLFGIGVFTPKQDEAKAIGS